jgi:hypothetical protein
MPPLIQDLAINSSPSVSTPLINVIEGSGTMIVGGTPKDEKRRRRPPARREPGSLSRQSMTPTAVPYIITIGIAYAERVAKLTNGPNWSLRQRNSRGGNLQMGMSALGQRAVVRPDKPNVRIAPKADLARFFHFDL